MEIDEALTAYLLAQSSLTALIGRRLYPEETPSDVDLATQTAVTYIFIDDIKLHTHQGQNGLESPNVQFTAYAPTRARARAVSNQIKTALCDYVGTIGGLTVQYIKLSNELPGKWKSTDGTVNIHMVDLEFEVNFERA